MLLRSKRIRGVDEKLLTMDASLYLPRGVPAATLSLLAAVLLYLAIGKALPILYHHSHRQPRGYRAASRGVATKPPAPARPEPPHHASLQLYRELYHKLHNLEDHPEVTPQARYTLIALFSSAIQFNGSLQDGGIMSCNEHGPNGLEAFLERDQDAIFTRWEHYMRGRRNGGPRCMFKDQQEARHWLKQNAPLKYVDGAWLGHISAAAAPFAFRDVVKCLWQTLSEEYGDGDLNKNHVHVYRKLMKEHAPELPYAANSAEFVNTCRGSTDAAVWRAAVAQLLLSVFAHEFFPELLGYNMHFERVTLQTLVAAKELKELGIDPYYFHLHTSIDNSDTGHSAMAVYAATQYLDKMERHGNGAEAREKAWKRIQIGYALSQYLDQAPPSSADTHPTRDKPRAMAAAADTEKKLIDILRAKGVASGRLHCGSSVKLGSRKLGEWLSPEFLVSPERESEFMHCLANAGYWVRRGNSAESRLVREFSWGGRMFGAFTNVEIDVLKAWIDSLSDNNPPLLPYWSFSERPVSSADENPRYRDIPGDSLAASLPSVLDSCSQWRAESGAPPSVCAEAIRRSRLCISGTVDMTRLLPLWFAHLCLLQHLISIPFESASRAGCAILRLLRAQGGFCVESAGVAGMDEARRTDVVGILELGLEMAQEAGLVVPQSLEEALEMWPSDSANTMLHLSTRPKRSSGLLVGISWAFIDLHGAVSSYEHTEFLSPKSCHILSIICQRERESLTEYVEELQDDNLVCQRIRQGYAWGTQQIQSCFG